MTRLSLQRTALLILVNVALLFGGVEAFAATRRAAPAQAERVGREFKIKAGRTVTFKGESLRLRFVRVADDSRCPTNVDCIWAGNAEVLIEASAGGARGKKALALNTNASQGRAGEGEYRRYTVKLVGLSPYPQSARKIRRDEYIATLLVTKQ
jgi:hypothetical protein